MERRLFYRFTAGPAEFWVLDQRRFKSDPTEPGRAARLLGRAKIACIGPITRDAALERGLRVDVMASPYTIEALILALERSFR